MSTSLAQASAVNMLPDAPQLQAMLQFADTLLKSGLLPGTCACGCGQKTTIAPKTCVKRGIFKGQPVRFVHGHGRRTAPMNFLVQDMGYTTPCWVWQLSTDSGGYARYFNGRMHRPHVEQYHEKYGPVPQGLHLDHLCRIRRCINPDHLEPVTCAENQRRGLNTKLSPGEVLAIRELRANGVSLGAISARFGISQTHVCSIAYRRVWKDI